MGLLYFRKEETDCLTCSVGVSSKQTSSRQVWRMGDAIKRLNFEHLMPIFLLLSLRVREWNFLYTSIQVYNCKLQEHLILVYTNLYKIVSLYVTILCNKRKRFFTHQAGDTVCTRSYIVSHSYTDPTARIHILKKKGI